MPHLNLHLLKVRLDFGLDPMLLALRQDQKTALSAGMFERHLQECFYELFGHDLARDSLRDLDYGYQVKSIDPRFNLPCRTGRGAFGPEVWTELVELPHLSIGSPTQIAVAGVLQVERGNFIEPARLVECGSALIGYRLDVEEPVTAS